jgi:hypothetical protein
MLRRIYRNDMDRLTRENRKNSALDGVRFTHHRVLLAAFQQFVNEPYQTRNFSYINSADIYFPFDWRTPVHLIIVNAQ